MHRQMKRAFDIAVAGLGLALLALLLVLIALMILLVDGRPVFYVSERMKTLDQSFMLLKFRTMKIVPGTALEGVAGPEQKRRISPLGRVLRSLRVDELPQLINILRGDMSIVGPRPPLRKYTEEFSHIYRDVLSSKPGLTGLATLHYFRHEERLIATAKSPQEAEEIYRSRCIPRKARLDMIYGRYASVCFDIAILVRTIMRVLSR